MHTCEIELGGGGVTIAFEEIVKFESYSPN